MNSWLQAGLHGEPVDFRLNINGLALLAEQALGLDPFAVCVYVFSNRRRYGGRGQRQRNPAGA